MPISIFRRGQNISQSLRGDQEPHARNGWKLVISSAYAADPFFTPERFSLMGP